MVLPAALHPHGHFNVPVVSTMFVLTLLTSPTRQPPHFTLTVVPIASFYATHCPHEQFAVPVSMLFIHALSLTPKHQPPRIVLDVVSPTSLCPHNHLDVRCSSCVNVICSRFVLIANTSTSSHFPSVVPPASFHATHYSQDQFAVPVVFMSHSLAKGASSTIKEGIAK